MGYARSKESPDTKYFNTFTNIVDGLSDLTSLINNLQDIFSLLTSDDFTDIQSNLSVSVPEDAYLNISQLVKKYGYPFEEHTVITDDGYVLNFHRIPHGRDGKRNNIVVFLMHGITDSSDSWVIQGPDSALSYILADHGFDVWMGNSRGNKHAPSHVKLNSTQSEFWEFTWEEIGIYDTTKMIDYILNITDKEDVYYIGHSQGTTSFYAMNSLRPEYNKKIKMMFSLAPIAWVSHVRSPLIRMLSPTYNILGHFLSNINIYAPSPVSFNKVSAYICSVLNIKCKSYLTLIIGNDYKSINDTMLPIMLGHMFSGSSMLQLVHYGQLVKSERFCRYDFGSEVNFKVYGDVLPPITMSVI
ncbi:lipase 1 [Aphomia sociella]